MCVVVVAGKGARVLGNGRTENMGQKDLFSALSS